MGSVAFGKRDPSGAWQPYGGTSGTVNIGAGTRVKGISASAAASGPGSMVIASGDVFVIPAGQSISWNFEEYILLGPFTIVFDSTNAYAVEAVRPPA